MQIKTDTVLSYSSVYFVDKDTGFVVGENGITLRTTDGGSTWDTRKIDDYIGGYLDVFNLSAITFTDKNTGFIVGAGYYGNEIYKTTDCGRTWQWNEWIVNPKVYGLNDISFIDKNHGYAAGEDGVLLITKDGGNTWRIKSTGSYNQSACFTDTLNGIVVGNGSYYPYINRTTDGGIIWRTTDPGLIPGYGPNKVRFSDKDNGWIVGGKGMLYRTTNGGKNWASINEKPHQFNSIYFVDENTGWAVGDSGIILHTTDGGDNWIKQYQNDSLIFNSIQAFDAQNVIIVGEKFDNGHYVNSMVVITNDGGQSWQKHTDSLGALNSISFPTRNTGWIVGKGIYKSTNGGLSWQSQSDLFGLGHVQFIDERTGWVVNGVRY